MMNEEMEQFEQRLSRQTLRPVPAEWREEILAAAAVSPRPSQVAHRSFLSTLSSQLSTLFWPHPVAWAGLATVWILILVVDLSIRDKTPVVAEKDSPPPPQVIVELRQQQRLLAELMGPRDTGDADRLKPLAPRPRSERVEFLAA